MADIPSQPAPVIFEDAYYERLRRVEQQHGWFRGLRAVGIRMLRAAGADEAGLFVDAGCGTGAVLEAARGALHVKRAVGFDLALEGLRRCRASGLQLLAAARVETLPLRDSSADVIHCADVLQHLAPGADRGFAREAARVLRPGGILYLRTMRRQAQGPGPRPGDPHYHQYSLAEVAALCEQVGLRVERLTSVNIVPALKGRLRGRRPAGGPGIPQTSPREPLNTVLRVLLDLEGRVLARTGWRSDLGLSIVCVARKAG